MKATIQPLESKIRLITFRVPSHYENDSFQQNADAVVQSNKFFLPERRTVGSHAFAVVAFVHGDQALLSGASG